MSIFSIFLIPIIIVAFLLILVVMVQNPKGGGLSSSFGGSGTQIIGGVKKTSDFLDKSTWVLAIVLVVLILASNITLKSDTDSKLLDEEGIENAIPKTNIPENSTQPAKDSTKIQH
jgi:preprotein translocase subunit SecG